MNPYLRRPLNLTTNDRAAWRAYEHLSALAAEQYRVMPISYHQPGPAMPCRRCHQPTKAKGLVCKPCRVAS